MHDLLHRDKSPWKRPTAIRRSLFRFPLEPQEARCADKRGQSRWKVSELVNLEIAIIVLTLETVL